MHKLSVNPVDTSTSKSEDIYEGAGPTKVEIGLFNPNDAQWLTQHALF